MAENALLDLVPEHVADAGELLAEAAEQAAHVAFALVGLLHLLEEMRAPARAGAAFGSERH